MNQTELMQALRKELGREPVSPMIHRAIVSACEQLPERRGRRPFRILDWAPRATTGLLCVLALFGFGAMLALNLNAPENNQMLPGAASSALLSSSAGSAASSELVAEGSVTELGKKLGLTTRDSLRLDCSSRMQGFTSDLFRALYGESKDFYFRDVYSAYTALLSEDVDLILVPDLPEDEDPSYADRVERFPIAKDALCFFVKEENSVENLSLTQLKDIYDGAISNWSEVGGPDEKLSVVRAKKDHNDAQLVLEERIIPYDEMREDLQTITMERPISGICNVTRDWREIGNEGFALGYGYSGNDSNQFVGLKHLSVDGVYPDQTTILDGSYPLSYTYYAVIRKEEAQDAPARKVAQWLQTEDAESLFESLDLIRTSSQAELSEQELKAAVSEQLHKAVSFQYSFPLRAEGLLAGLLSPEATGWSAMFDWGAVQQEAETRQQDYSLIYDQKAASTMQFYGMAQINDAVSAALRDEEVLTVDGDVMDFALDSVEQRSETSCRAEHHETVWRASIYRRNVGFHVVLTFERRAACTELVLEDGLWKVGEDLSETSEPYRSSSGWYSENKGVFPTVEEALCYLRDLDLDLQNPFGEGGPQSAPQEERSETEQALMKGLELEGTYGMAFTPETLLESLQDKPGVNLSELWDWDALREQRRQAAPDYGAYYEETLAKEYLERYYKGIESDAMDDAVPLENGQTAFQLLSETDAGSQRELEVSYVDWNTTLSYEDGLYHFNVFYWKYHDSYTLELDGNGQWKYCGLHERLEEPEYDAFQQFGSSSSAAEALEFAKRFDPAAWNPFQ